MAIRLALLSQHYRDDWMWTDDLLAAAVERLATWREAVRLDAGLNADATIAAVRAALADDLNAPAALAAVDAWAGASVAIDSDDTDAPRRWPGPSTPCWAFGSRTSDGNLHAHAVGIGVSHGVSYIRGARFRHPAAGVRFSRRVNNSRVYRGRCKSEPAVTVRDPQAASLSVDLVKFRDRR